MPKEADEIIPTRWTLINRLKDWDDQASWKDFFDIYWKLIYGVGRKAGLNDAEAQEVVQETVIAVAKKMETFKADPDRGSFKGFLLHITRYRIVDQFRKRPPAGCNRASDDTARTSTIDRVPDPASLFPEAKWDEEWQKNLIDAALDRIKQKVSPKQYKIFYFHVLKKFSAGQTAKTLGVNIAQVYLAKHRVAALLKKEVKALEAEIP